MDPMKNDPEELLWELSRRREEGETGPPPSDGELESWRAGRLPEADAGRVEALLAADPAARARLAELAEVRPPAPPPAVRGHVLARFAGEAPRRRILRWLPAAALAAGLLAAIGISLLGPSRLPAGLAYDVTARGLARERSTDPAAGAFEAYPETRVRIEVEPRGEAEADVELGLYREGPGRLEHIPVRVEMDRGAASLTAAASALVGTVPGPHDLWVVASRPGDLPATVRKDPGADSRTLLEDEGRRRVYPLRLMLLASPSPEN